MTPEEIKQAQYVAKSLLEHVLPYVDQSMSLDEVRESIEAALPEAMEAWIKDQIIFANKFTGSGHMEQALAEMMAPELYEYFNSTEVTNA